MRGGRLLLLAAVIAAGGGAVWWRLHQPAEAAAWQGYAEADYVRVAPTQQGKLVSLAVARGDAVAAGAPLFAQDDVEDRAARDQAEAQLDQAAAQLTNLQSASRDTEIAQAGAELADARAARDRINADLARNAALVSSGAATRQIVDQERADARSAQAKVEAAEARLAQMREPTGRQHEIDAQRATVEAARAALVQAQWRLDQRHVAAPAGGRVADTYARPGETIPAGGPVVELLPPENILVRFFVPETTVASLHRGDRVGITCDSCPSGLVGRISFVAPQSEYTPPVIYSEDTRGKLVFLIEARPAPDRAALLHPGEPVNVRPLGREPAP
jgi:HlyD family secretion protein